MIIRENHRDQLKTAFFMESAFIIFNLIVFIRRENISLERTAFVAFFIAESLWQILILVEVIVETKKYYVCNNGIIVTWCGYINCFISWSEIILIHIEKIQYNGLYKYDYLICSKIPIKRSNFFVNKPIIDADWIFFNPRKVIAIRLSDMSEGQFEEFWTYVPDRLKQ